MVAGGISFFRLSHIIFVEGTIKDFSYGQTLLFYKEDIEEMNKDSHTNIILNRMVRLVSLVKQISIY